jgi:hypothetical protein
MAPVKQPSEHHKANNQDGGANSDCPENVENLMHPWDLLKRHIFAGSCCTGVAVLYALSSWDHGWIPGLQSQFALASDLQTLRAETATTRSDVAEMYVLSIARAILDQNAELCVEPSRLKEERLEELQRKYKERTGDRYPVTTCPASRASKGTNGG